MKKSVFTTVLLFLLSFLLAGCGAKTPAPGTGSDIVAYIDGMPVYAQQREQYIELAKWTGQAYDKAFGELSKEVPAQLDPSIRFSLEMYSKNRKNTAAGSEKDWNQAYYSAIAIGNELYTVAENGKDMVESLAEQNIEEILDTGKITICEGIDIDVQPAFTNFAKEYGLSYEQYVKTVVKSYYERSAEDEYLSMYFANKIYKGKAPAYDGKTLTKEYEAYVIDVGKQYQQYTKDLVKKAKIVEMK